MNTLQNMNSEILVPDYKILFWIIKIKQKTKMKMKHQQSFNLCPEKKSISKLKKEEKIKSNLGIE